MTLSHKRQSPRWNAGSSGTGPEAEASPSLTGGDMVTLPDANGWCNNALHPPGVAVTIRHVTIR